MKKEKWFIVVLAFLTLVNNAQSQTIEYPYNFTFNGNPLIRNHGAADPDVHVWNDTVWMYCSQDHKSLTSDSYAAMDGYHAFSSTDMINWTDHGEILHSRNVNWGIDGYMWAPGAARKNGKYYLYYPHKDKSGNWRIGIATSDRPDGPFTDIGYPMQGIGGIDPAIFIDDNGEAYIYNNSAIVAKLKPNMTELAESPRKINYDKTNQIKDNYLEGFAEGSYMHKRNGLYYYSYSNWHNNQYQAFYAVGDNPYGPFEWKGPMAPNPQGAQDHHSVIEFKGLWYYFYHIAIPEYPENKDGQGRITCFDRLFYNEDGTIKKVDHTRNVLSYEPTQKAFNNAFWQFPGDTVTAWQFDYFNQYDYFNKTYGDTLFALDSAQTIGLYGCNDTAGINIRSYKDIDQFKDAAQFNWDNNAQTFEKNGQWLEYSVVFNNDEPYQLLLQARKNISANFKLTIYNKQNDTIYYKEFDLTEDFKSLMGGNEQTELLLSKFPLLGLWGSYIVRFDWFDNIGEPGIFGGFSFLESNLDVKPPEWYYVSVGNITKGTDIVVMTTEAAKVYLVPAGTAADTISITAAAVALVEVAAYSQVKIATSALLPGDYVVYALDSSNNISEASRLITLQIPVNTPLISNNSEIIVTYNSSIDLIKINSTNELSQIDIYNILGKKIESKKCNGKTYNFQINEWLSGVYLVQVFEKDGTFTTKKVFKR